jgi:phosphoglycolate phosphatase
MMPKLVLFDIDGTLIDSGGASRRSLNRAILDRYGIKDACDRVVMSGKTDIQIIKECFSMHNLSVSERAVQEIVPEYVEHLTTEIQNNQRHMKPGAANLLKNLCKSEAFLLGLLTGNIEEGALIKLSAFGLWDYFAGGAFGSDNEDRNKLLPIVLEKFRDMTGFSLEPSKCIVIGDTPKDVDCARPFGAITIAVSTGRYRYEELITTGATYVLQNLEEALDVVAELRLL